jgi:hypothetical protein
MKENHGSKHTHHITHTNHRISHTEGEVLYDIHPENGAGSKENATADKLPIDE